MGRKKYCTNFYLAFEQLYGRLAPKLVHRVQGHAFFKTRFLLHALAVSPLITRRGWGKGGGGGYYLCLACLKTLLGF